MERILPPQAKDWQSELTALAESMRTSASRPPLYERLLQQMPPYLRERVHGEVMVVRSVFSDKQNNLTAVQMEAAINQRVLAGYKEVATDLVLSHNGTIIQSYQCLRAIMAHELESELLDCKAPRVIDHTGMVFLDVDGMKTIVDCTNHTNGCAYLQRLADILVSPPDAVRTWCEQQGLTTEAYSVGGDEFVMLVRSKKVLNDGLLQELSTRMHTAIQEDNALRTQFISFDDPNFLLDFSFAHDERREQIFRLENDDQRRAALADVRSQLPPEFIPSVSIGTSRLQPAVVRAITQAEDQATAEEPATFDAVAYNAFQGMVQAADDRSFTSKRTKKQRMREEDPKLFAFLMRNAEGRELLAEVGIRDQIIARLRSAIRTLADDMRATLEQTASAEDREQALAAQRIFLEQAETKLRLMTELDNAIQAAA